MKKDLPDTEHPLKKELKRMGVSHVKAAHAVGVKFQTFWRYLNSYDSMPPQVEHRLEKFIAERK